MFVQILSGWITGEEGAEYLWQSSASSWWLEQTHVSKCSTWYFANSQ
jgi:hypothetical protein